ncbi:MAG: hypothetical protein ACIAXF_08555 [Phycisphaerales bacterium JB063]
MTFCKHIAAASLTLAAAATAAAGTADIEVLADGSHEGIDLSVTVQESNLLGYDFEFVIENNTQMGNSTITGIYFESGWGNLVSTSPFNRNLDLLSASVFTEGSVTPEIGGWSGSLVSYEAAVQVEINLFGGLGNLLENLLAGLGLGQSATVAFVAQTDTTLADLELALGSQGYGIGVQLGGLDNGSDEDWGLAASLEINLDLGLQLPECPPNDCDPSAVPTPSAALLGLGMVGMVMKRRRRDH